MDQLEPIKVLGEGSFGKVYLMRHKAERKLVCVKVIRIQNVPRKEREACRMEVALLKRLNHPNIVGYRDSFLAKENLCIVMQFADGGDLSSVIEKARKANQMYAESKILQWFVQMALGLHYMHSQRVLHRDLKTQNIFLLGNGRLVLGDLGISKVLEGTTDFAETCIGTPYYMSPEIFKNKPYNHKSDIWALGCVLYETATLSHAFDAKSLNGLASKIIKGKYPQIDARYSKSLRDLIAAMLATNPAQRPHLEITLQKSFVKKHVKDFLADIVSRPSGSVGEGTMQVRAAVAGSGANSGAAVPRGIVGDGVPLSHFDDSAQVASLKEQLAALQMQDVVAAVFAPKEKPQNTAQAQRAAREQASALRREEERRKAVEEALDKLRKEREQRLKDRERLRAEAQRRAVARAQRMQQEAQRQQQKVADRRAAALNYHHQQQQQQQQRARTPAYHQNPRDRPSVRRSQIKTPAKRPSTGASNGRPASPTSSVAPSVVAGKGIASRPDRQRASRAQQSAEAQRVAELEQWELRQRRAAAAQAARAGPRRRVPPSAQDRGRRPAQANGSERSSPTKSKDAKRDARREAERAKQREIIAQLKKDKILLDEKERLRVQRRNEQKLRDQQRQEQIKKKNQEMCEMETSPPPLEPVKSCWQQERHEGSGKNPVESNEVVPTVARAPSQAAVHPFGAGPLSARERVLQRKQERDAEIEAARLRQLNEAHAQASQLRQRAKDKHNDQYRSSLDPLARARISGNTPHHVAEAAFESRNHPSPETKIAIPKPTSDEETNKEKDDGARIVVEDDGVSVIDAESVEEDESMGWAQPDPDKLEDVEEDIHHREEELQAELEYTKTRCEELRKTLHDTKTFIATSSKNEIETESKPPPPEERKKWAFAAAGALFKKDDIPAETVAEDGEVLGDIEEEDEDEDVSVVVAQPLPSRIELPPPKTPRDRDELTDAMSPSSRLADRIRIIRQRCSNALGAQAFQQAYAYLKALQEAESDEAPETTLDIRKDNLVATSDAAEQSVKEKLRSMLGEENLHFASLIDQLIFMEDSR